jgi:hypothetical protein
LVWELVALFPFLVILITIEALIVLVNLRRTAIGSEILECILLVPVWLMCFILLFFTAIHLFVIPVGGEVMDQVETDNKDNIDSDLEISEQTLLLRPRNGDIVTHPSSRNTGPKYAWRQLLIPMEILLLSCLVPIWYSAFRMLKSFCHSATLGRWIRVGHSSNRRGLRWSHKHDGFLVVFKSLLNAKAFITVESTCSTRECAVDFLYYSRFVDEESHQFHAPMVIV